MTYALGVLASLIVQVVKKYLGTTKLGTYIALFVVSILAGAIYVELRASSFWTVFTQVVVAASAFHNLLLRRLEK